MSRNSSLELPRSFGSRIGARWRARLMQQAPLVRCCQCLRFDTSPEPQLLGNLAPEQYRAQGYRYVWSDGEGSWLATTCASCAFLQTVEALLEEWGPIRDRLAEAAAACRRRRFGPPPPPGQGRPRRALVPQPPPPLEAADARAPPPPGNAPGSSTDVRHGAGCEGIRDAVPAVDGGDHTGGCWV